MFESFLGERIISQLRKGYIGLSDYLYKCNVKETANCDCGEKESVSHYLLDCPNYENEKRKKWEKDFSTIVESHILTSMLLDTKQKDYFKEWRNTIISELETYVVETWLFTTWKSCK